MIEGDLSDGFVKKRHRVNSKAFKINDNGRIRPSVQNQLSQPLAVLAGHDRAAKFLLYLDANHTQIIMQRDPSL